MFSKPGPRDTVGKLAGMDKYLLYSERHRRVTVDTEIAAFEQSNDSSACQRAVCMDRLPRH